jgi:hypothetical protein
MSDGWWFLIAVVGTIALGVIIGAAMNDRWP